MKHENFKIQAIAEKDKLDDHQEVVSVHAESNLESLSEDPDVTMEVVDFDDQATKGIDFDNEKIVNVFEESNAESRCDDRDVMANVVDCDDQATEVIRFDDQAERSSCRRRVAEQETGDMLVELGPILIDKHGYILGEFSWIDDLNIV
ncbi:hypothetical protein POM88_033945 [Heracleum sosnowskyi]|uniref:Uncharacterized protein n=1 Tax=Heracleum sosnowskyi TaxID=360622 RepID=A0AAD8HJG9_9APIA|nr:hypothetical protein POM88_033945 [Heracleum sosnowskyi]